ncbi:hypothetical protein VULLAG_LOCUS6277 [Vulpes lagopus]
MECASFLGLLSWHGHRGADVTPGAAGSPPPPPGAVGQGTVHSLDRLWPWWQVQRERLLTATKTHPEPWSRYGVWTPPLLTRGH